MPRAAGTSIGYHEQLFGKFPELTTTVWLGSGIFAPKGLLNRDPQNFDVRRSLRAVCVTPFSDYFRDPKIGIILL